MYKKTLTADWPFFGGVFSDLIDGAKEELKNLFYPGVNVSETDKAYTISVMAPGLKKEDFKLGIENNILEISYSGKESTETKWLRKEWAIGEFKRKFTVKNDADQSNVTAKYEDGVLNITVPKKVEASSKSAIKVQ